MIKVTIAQLVKKFNLEVVYGREFLNREIHTNHISRPGLELAGHFDFYPSERLQVFGNKEVSFYSKLSDKLKKERTPLLFCDDTPAVLFTRNLEIPEYIYENAQVFKTPILRTNMTTSMITNQIHSYLSDYFAPQTTVHGVLMDIHGIGVLIKGKSSIGKSETALELIQKGHLLVADDRVDIISKENILVGHAPELLKNVMEVRGIGIIDVMTMFGAGSIRDSKVITLIVELENWDEHKDYNRIGTDLEFENILNTKIDKIVLPVKPGRNVSAIIEVAAMNYRLRNLGHNAPEQFIDRLNNYIINKKGSNK